MGEIRNLLRRLSQEVDPSALIAACGRSLGWLEALYFLRRLRAGEATLMARNAAISAVGPRWQLGLLGVQEAQGDEITFTAALSACEQACRSEGNWRRPAAESSAERKMRFVVSVHDPRAST
ncbi:unnamed protein product [Effrenium voratum]|nr:unnamed protein product [Effrenium voratum]